MAIEEGIKIGTNPNNEGEDKTGIVVKTYDPDNTDKKGIDNTKIIYPADLQPGEEIPVVIMVPGDGGHNNFRDDYFNDYNGTLPRAIYVVAGRFDNESKNSNAYTDVKQFLANNFTDENGNTVSISEVGVEAYSGGGGAGLLLAKQAAEDKDNIPVYLLLTDAAKKTSFGKYSELKDLDNLFVVYAASYNNDINGGNKILANLTWGHIKDNIPSSRRVLLKWWKLNHAEVNDFSQKYNVLLSIMGLTNTFFKKKSDFKKHGLSSKLSAFTSVVAYESAVLSEYLDALNTSLGGFSEEHNTNAGGNDLLTKESELATKIVNAVSNLSEKISLDVAVITGIGDSYDNMDKDLKEALKERKTYLKNLLNTKGFNKKYGNLFTSDDFKIPSKIKKIKEEEPIEVVDENQNENGNEGR